MREYVYSLANYQKIRKFNYFSKINEFVLHSVGAKGNKKIIIKN